MSWFSVSWVDNSQSVCKKIQKIYRVHSRPVDYLCIININHSAEAYKAIKPNGRFQGLCSGVH